MIETCWGQEEAGEEEEQSQQQPQGVQVAGRNHQAKEDMVGRGVQEVAHLFEVMMWGEPGPLVEVVGQVELKRCDDALVGQGVLELLVMGFLGFLKLYSIM
jgi:hypothetical protein